ncbi:CoA pyrophosphatase [Sphingorhabdus sp. Alg239-R122]|uniref:CoA pyrophosphatase n=1 Tax=Sphingorhabdus sp. Alg239-R122 TaxID=2305989 RepID=UPI0013DA9995|nr:CoA pyrophosphatase [Sphingorhabdus sp. Alg239-R122]
MTLYDRLSKALSDTHGVYAGIQDERHFFDTQTRLIPAAVLIPVTDRARPGVILTQRPSNMRSHPGQVAFPGGKIDPEDHDAKAAALREAEEELAIPPSQVNIIGAVEQYHSGSGFEITPVLAIVPPDLALRPNPGEVEDWFEVPLHHILDPGNLVEKSAMWQGRKRQYYEIMWQDRRIWGVTAGIIKNLAARLDWTA